MKGTRPKPMLPTAKAPFPFGAHSAGQQTQRWGHTESELKELARFFEKPFRRNRVLAEATGHYHEPSARHFHMGGIFVPVMHAVIARDYHRNDICKVKTGRTDAVKLANTALDRLLRLQESIPEEERRQTLKISDRQYSQSLCITYGKATVMKTGGFCIDAPASWIWVKQLFQM